MLVHWVRLLVHCTDCWYTVLGAGTLYRLLVHCTDCWYTVLTASTLYRLLVQWVRLLLHWVRFVRVLTLVLAHNLLEMLHRNRVTWVGVRHSREGEMALL
jgi:hypothetical protein